MNLRKSVQEFSLECKSFKRGRGKGRGGELTQTPGHSNETPHTGKQSKSCCNAERARNAAFSSGNGFNK